MNTNHSPDAILPAAAKRTAPGNRALAAALLAGLALAGLGLASVTVNASPFNSGPLPEPTGPEWIHPHQSLIALDSTPYGYAPLPEPTGPQWTHWGAPAALRPMVDRQWCWTWDVDRSAVAACRSSDPPMA